MSNLNRNIRIYYITRVFVGLRFIIPIWVTFFLKIITFEQMAIAEVVATIIGVALELPTGGLADLIGRKYTVAIGFIISGIGYMLLAGADGFAMYLIFQTLASIGNTFISGAEEALVYDTLVEAKKTNLYSNIKSKEALIYRSTLLFSTIAGGYLYKIKDILPYMLTGIFITLSGVFYVFTIEPLIDSKKYTLKKYIQNIKYGFIESFKTTQNIYISIYYIIIFAISFMLMGYFEQPYTKWLGFNEQQIGWIFAGTLFIKIFTVMFSKSLEKRFSSQFINFFLPFLTGLFLLLSFQNKIVGLVILFAENIILAYRFIFTQKLYNDSIESKFRASAGSTINMFVLIVYSIFVYGLSEGIKFSNIGITFNIFGLILILTSLLALKIKGTKETEEWKI